MNKLKLNRIEFKSGIILFIGCIAGSVMVSPYAYSLLVGVEITFFKFILSSFMNALISFPPLIYFGLLLKRKSPVVGTPILDGAKKLNKSDLLIYGITTGIIGWVLIYVFDLCFLQITPELRDLNQKVPSAIQGFLASFYGGIAEEVLLRFFFMALLIWPLKRLGNVGIWMSIFCAAIIFGIGHLPATAQALQLTVSSLPHLIIFRAIVLNSIIGIICGWLYWKKGLEIAMISHFSADIGLHVVSPLF